MRSLKPIPLSLVVLAASVSNAVAHSLDKLEAQLGDREQYFQPVDREAPPFALEDAEGRAVSLGDLRGKVVVLHFVYTNCPDVCPLHAERIAEIQEMINQTPMRELVQFVTITTDPEHDTPEVMREYGSAHGLDSGNWMFLTSGPNRPEDATRKLAERFGHKFTRTESGYQIHGLVTHVIDREGRWQANFHGLKFDPTNLVLYINALTHSTGKRPLRKRAGGRRCATCFENDAAKLALSRRHAGPQKGDILMRILLTILALTLAVGGTVQAEEPRTAMLYKNPACACCDSYADYLRENGFEIAVEATHDLPLIKRQHGVPAALEGCHTTMVGGYVVEGHVPVATLLRLLTEKPAIKGISLPGMPAGSPGMFGEKTEPFTIYEIADGPAKVYAVE